MREKKREDIMKVKAIIPLLFLVVLSACETPWYRLQRENDELRAENEQLRSMPQQTNVGSDEEIYKIQGERDNAVAALKKLRAEKAKNDETLAELRKKLASTGLSMTMVDGKPAIVLPNGVFFNSGKHTLNTSGQNVLEKVASVLNGKYAKFKISVQGHTDSDPIVKSKDRYEDNYQLSSDRAREVIKYLSKNGVENKRLQGAFHAANKPVSTNKTAAGKKKNRRVEIVLIG